VSGHHHIAATLPTGKMSSVHIQKEDGWAPEPVWKLSQRENPSLSKPLNPNHAAQNQSPYQLSKPRYIKLSPVFIHDGHIQFLAHTELILMTLYLTTNNGYFNFIKKNLQTF
jgi:hypothetical protein